MNTKYRAIVRIIRVVDRYFCIKIYIFKPIDSSTIN